MLALTASAIIIGVIFGRGRIQRIIVDTFQGTTQAQRASVPPSTSAPKDLVLAKQAGALDYAGARIRFVAGAHFRMHPNTRQVDLLAGELEVTVTPKLPGRFQVVTPAFSVEVLGTHFTVGLDRVETHRGKIRVLHPSGTELAVLLAGQTWKPEQVGVSSSVPSIAPLAILPAVSLPGASTIPSRPRPRLQPVQMGLSAERLLTEARSILGAGNPALARTRIDAALDADPNRRQRAMAELLAADTLLVESRYQAALAGYRRTMALFSGFPEAETAAFAIAQILCERGGKAEARAALLQYLERFPQGRFHEDAVRKLAQLPRP
jgi:hypothetical protein